MSAPRKLSGDEVQNALGLLPGWSLQNERLHREFKFKSFVEAFGFMAQVALAAESRNHHPDWSNAYNRVRIDLTTHEAGGITERDADLATRINEIAAGMAARL
jgi:4a-hydroxytetrahydrobiopterin dehydratase